MVNKFEFTDRYKAFGILYPDPHTMCEGQCEGVGRVPIYKDEEDEKLRLLWLAAEEKSPSDDGWHFVICPDCNGTGFRPTATNEVDDEPYEQHGAD